MARLPLAHQPGEVWDYGPAVNVLSRDIGAIIARRPPPLGEPEREALGYTLDQVATINRAKIIKHAPKLGTLAVGAPGDVASGTGGGAGVVYRHAQQRKAWLKAVQTVTAGVA